MGEALGGVSVELRRWIFGARPKSGRKVKAAARSFMVRTLASLLQISRRLAQENTAHLDSA